MININKIKIIHRYKNILIDMFYNIDLTLLDIYNIGEMVFYNDKISNNIKSKLNLNGVIVQNDYLGKKDDICCEFTHHISSKHELNMIKIQKIFN